MSMSVFKFLIHNPGNDKQTDLWICVANKSKLTSVTLPGPNAGSQWSRGGKGRKDKFTD